MFISPITSIGTKTEKDFNVHVLKNMRKLLPANTSSSKHACQAAINHSRISVGVILAASMIMAGCSKPVEKSEDVRPVRVVKIQASGVETAFEFAGDVRPRIESRLGFRVGGKIASRKVDVGMQVKRGDLLMQLDPQDLQLAQAQAQAAVRAAQSNRDLALAERKRYEELRAKNFVSQAVLDAKETAYRAAQSSFEQAQAGLQAQSNQASYAALVADADGVVTAIDAEVGQVVAAGTPVVRLAQMAEKEVVIGLPENKLELMAASKDVQIRLWANQDLVLAGKIREIAPVADPATRTYLAKVSLLNPPPQVKLGMTAYVSFSNKVGNAVIKVPLSALYQEKGLTSVWVVESGAVKLVPVNVAGPSGNEMLLSKGVVPGQMVVTAGVHLLKPGQKVKVLEEIGQPGVQHEPMGMKQLNALSASASANAAAASAPAGAASAGASK